MNTLVFNFFNQFQFLVGKPQLIVSTSQKIVVQIPYFVPKRVSNNFLMLTDNKVRALGSAIFYLLASYPETSVDKDRQRVNCSGVFRSYTLTKIEVRLVRLRYPYLDATILAKYLALNANKYNFTRMHKALFNKVSTSSQE